MIQDARVLQPEWVPREVEHRNAEANALSNALEPIAEGQPAETAILVGPSGAGKTCLAHFTLERVRKQLLDIEFKVVNCWQDYNRFSVLYRILDEIGKTVDIQRHSTAHDQLLNRLRDYEGDPYIVVFDEVDQLEDPEILYDIYSIPDIHMMLIANREEDLFGRLDQRLVSRLQSARRVRFNKYSLDETVSILEARVQTGLEPEAIDQAELERIADVAAGDARVAIGVLRAAAREAENRGAERISDDILDAAIPEAQAQITRTTVNKLNDHQQVLYEILREHRELRPPDLYEKYREQVDEPRTDRTVRNYIQKMAHYNLVRAEGQGRARTYHFDG